MLHFETLESSYRVSVNGNHYYLNEAELDNVFWHTADLYDNMHRGAAPVTLGSSTVVLSQDQWQDLYDITEKRIQSDIEMNEDTEAVVFH